MITIGQIGNHMWQSTIFAGAAALLALAFRRNGASTRYWLWLAASLKFLVPFSLLVSAGAWFEWRHAPAIAPAVAAAVGQLTQPLDGVLLLPVTTSVARGSTVWPMLLAGVWLCGAAGILGRWMRRWAVVREAVRSASPLPIDAPIAVMSAPSRFEPGVFGIFRPMLLLPEGIAGRLTGEQLRAILAHELCHVRRRDNLASAVHMLVEALFWFHPLVWWIGGRMVEERERACDEEVLRQGGEREAYAAGILTVCRFYLETPLACASGVTGAGLRKRIEAIMSNQLLAGMTFGRKLLLAAACVAAIGGPVAVGIAQDSRAGLKFDVASIKPADPNSRGMNFDIMPGSALKCTGVTLKFLVEFAYQVEDFQLSGGPSWMRTERYDIVAKPEKLDGSKSLREATLGERTQMIARMRERVRSLLADRFQLVVRKGSEERPVYHLVVAKNGPKLTAAPEGNGIRRNNGMIDGDGVAVEHLARVLSMVTGRPVVDKTGITGTYKFKMEWSEERGGSIDKGGIVVPTEPVEADPDKPTLFSALQEQLGLKLESAKGPVAMIAVEKAEKPTAN